MALEENKRGQEMLDELRRQVDSDIWNDWERDFLEGNASSDYGSLSSKQKQVVSRMWDKLTGG